MKKLKQVLALGGVLLLLGLYASTMIFALMDSPNSHKLFQLSVGMTILIPVLLYAILLVTKHLEQKDKRPVPAGPIKNVVFDIGNVLIAFDWDGYLDSLGFSPEVNAAMHRASWPNPEWEERDRGALSDEEYFQMLLKKAPAYEAELRKVFEGENQSLWAYDYANTWLTYLQAQGYGVYLLSNVSRHMLVGFKEALPALQKADGAIFSCEVQMLKPEPEIYDTLLDTYGLDPRECVFIDDRPENIHAAKKAGMQGIVFTDFKSAVAQLEALGVK